MAININFRGPTIRKPGYYGDPWWDHIWRLLRYDRNFTEEQITAFLTMTDTLIRLDMHQEGLWKGRNVK